MLLLDAGLCQLLPVDRFKVQTYLTILPWGCMVNIMLGNCSPPNKPDLAINQLYLFGGNGELFTLRTAIFSGSPVWPSCFCGFGIPGFVELCLLVGFCCFRLLGICFLVLCCCNHCAGKEHKINYKASKRTIPL